VGQRPLFDPKNADMTGWAGETTLDVEMAHAVAPGAKIVLVETAVAETEGVTGLPEMMDGTGPRLQPRPFTAARPDPPRPAAPAGP
jgi:hypothetical protein